MKKKEQKGFVHGRRMLRKTCVPFLAVVFWLLSSFNPSLAQNAESKNNVTLNLKNVSLEKVIWEIQKQTDLVFIYGKKDIEHLKNLNVKAENKNAILVLSELLENTDITVQEVDGTYVFKKKKTAKENEGPKVEISGKVVDKDGFPLPGVTILEEGTFNGTTTNEEGIYKLKISSDVKKLVYSFIGMKKQEVFVGGRTEINVVLEEEVSTLDEVVVTGFFERKQNTYTGAVTQVTAEELKKTGNQNVLQALGNIAPSFSIVSNNEMGSDPNTLPETQIRGASSFSDMKDNYTSSPNQPLFIVDGFETSITKVMDMDINRIESITLLKDATSKAIYGSKGANGVVVIETIKPKEGKLRVTYIGNINVELPDLSSYNMADASEKLEIERRAGVYTSASGDPQEQAQYDLKYNEIYRRIAEGANTNWMEIPLKAGIGQKHSINIEGGDKAFTYNADVSYKNTKGAMKGSDRDVVDGSLTLSYRYKNLIFKEQVNVTFTDYTNSPYGDFSDWVKMNPYWRAYNEDGSINEILGTYQIANSQGSHYIYNPLLNANSNYKSTGEYMNITNNFYIEWKINEDLKLTGRVGISKQKDETHQFYPSRYAPLNPNKTYAGVNINFISLTPDDGEDYFKRGIYQIQNSNTSSYTGEASVNYSKQIGKHLIFSNFVYSVSESKNDYVSLTGIGFADNATSITQAKSYQENSSPSGYENTQRDLGIMGSVNYSYDSRYLLDVNYRASASSLFGSKNRWGSFWSVGIGWNLHKEAFMLSFDWLNRLKLRASTGYSGSQNFKAYQAMATYQYFSDEIYDNVTGAYLLGLPNSELGWQKTRDDNIGVDFLLFDRLEGKFDYYVTTTDNMLTPISVVTSTGFSSYTENLGKTRNKGFELELRYRVIADSKRDIFLSVNGSIASNKNKILSIGDALRSINDQKDDETSEGGFDHETNKDNTIRPKVRYEEGQSLSAIWAVRSLGINPTTGSEIFLDKEGNRVDTWNADDQVVVGDALEKYRGVFGFYLDYKGFRLNANFSYRFGGQSYNSTLVDKVENLDLQYNVDRRAYTDTWTTVGQQAMYKKVTYPNLFTKPTSRFVFDQNELRLTTLSVGYDFRNSKFIKENHALSSLKVTLNMNDVFTLSSIKQERGTSYPYARAFVLTVQATF